MRGEQIVHSRVESGMAPAQRGDFRCRDARAPLEALADVGLDLVEVAGVKARGLPGLNGREDFRGLGPPDGIDGAGFEAEGF